MTARSTSTSVAIDHFRRALVRSRFVTRPVTTTTTGMGDGI
jgi:hypothetical protein